MNMKVQLRPQSFDPTTGTGQVLAHWRRHLPQYGIDLAGQDDEYDLSAGHIDHGGDVVHLHGLYWTAHYNAPREEHLVNARIVDCVRQARAVTVPSLWVAETFWRDMHLSPYIIPHGIDLDEWPVSSNPGNYVLWNKNRRTDVCDPAPVADIAALLPEAPFISTFADRSLPNLRTTGILPHEEMKTLIMQAGVYLSTTQETFGIGILEAMASGAPVVAWAWGNAPDLVSEDAGVLVPPHDLQATAEAIQYCLAHRQQMSEAARQAAARWQWSAAVEKLAEVYRATYREMQEPPTAAIIIPNFNYARYLPQAVASACSQTYPLLKDIIIVDDGSTDDSAEVAARLAQSDRRVRLIRQNRRGVAAARNAGIAVTDAMYICCLDADDTIEREFLQSCIAALEADRSLALAYTRLALMTDGQKSKSSWPGDWDFDRQAVGQNQVPTCCVFRRSAWERTGGYRSRYCPSGAGSEDAALWLQMGDYVGGARLVDDRPLFNYRMHGGATRRSGFKEPDWTFWASQLPPFASYRTPANRLAHPVRFYDRPAISVIIPVGPNHLDCLVDAIDSLEAQTFPFWEVIVVNDSGQELNLAWAPFVRQATTGQVGSGPGRARNLGFEMARADLIICLDADDMLHPTALARLLETWPKDDHIWVYPDIMIAGDQGRSEHYRCPDWNVEKLWRSGLGPVTALYPRRAWETAGGFNEHSPREDWDFHLRLARAGCCGLHLPEPLLYYRHHLSARHIYPNPEEIVRIHREFDLEELRMACKSCGKKTIRPPADSIFTSKSEAGFEVLEYTGPHTTDITFRGPTGRTYRFHRGGRAYVHPEDVAQLVKYGVFLRIEDANTNEPGAVRPAAGA